MEITVTVRETESHPEQNRFINSDAKRKVIRAGRRGGKTVGAAKLAVLEFMNGKRILYAAPTQEQVETFWYEVKSSLIEAIDKDVLYKNESLHIIEFPNTKQRIRAKTAWNADTLRGDYADLLILDEFQLMNEDTWETVGAPMLLDNDGDAVFIYTPPSLKTRSFSKASDKRYAAKLFEKAKNDKTGRWEAFTFTSHENPHISEVALAEIVKDMNARAIRQEIMAEDVYDVPGAIWNSDIIDRNRVDTAPPLNRIVIGVDPPGGVTECGIVIAGVGDNDHYYVLADLSLQAPPSEWGARVVRAFDEYQCDCIVAEKNYGGDMVAQTINTIAKQMGVNIKNKMVSATRGKAVRAEPVQARYEQNLVHHVGVLPQLEDEMTSWVPGMSANSPNRVDALVWSLTSLTTIKKAVGFYG